MKQNFFLLVLGCFFPAIVASEDYLDEKRPFGQCAEEFCTKKIIFRLGDLFLKPDPDVSVYCFELSTKDFYPFFPDQNSEDKDVFEKNYVYHNDKIHLLNKNQIDNLFLENKCLRNFIEKVTKEQEYNLNDLHQTTIIEKWMAPFFCAVECSINNTKKRKTIEKIKTMDVKKILINNLQDAICLVKKIENNSISIIPTIVGLSPSSIFKNGDRKEFYLVRQKIMHTRTIYNSLVDKYDHRVPKNKEKGCKIKVGYRIPFCHIHLNSEDFPQYPIELNVR